MNMYGKSDGNVGTPVATGDVDGMRVRHSSTEFETRERVDVHCCTCLEVFQELMA